MGHLVFIFIVLIMPGREPILHESQMPDVNVCMQTANDMLDKFIERRMPGKLQVSCGVVGPDAEVAQ